MYLYHTLNFDHDWYMHVSGCEECEEVTFAVLIFFTHLFTYLLVWLCDRLSRIQRHLTSHFHVLVLHLMMHTHKVSAQINSIKIRPTAKTSLLLFVIT